MIIFAHLLNDRSGSPRVLCATMSALVNPSDDSRLFVGSDGKGCLNDTDVSITRYWYWRSPWRLLTLFTYFFSQLCLLIRLLLDRKIARDALIYVNTLLPFGAAMYGRLTGRRVVYHLHEVSVSPAPLRWLLTTIARWTASELIYVSNFHRECLPIAGVRAHTVHNALDRTFLFRALASEYRHYQDGRFNVLMLASLRDYKGVPEFLSLAQQLVGHSAISFDLVVNDDEAAIKRYFNTVTLPTNVTVHPRTNDPAAYYARASLVLNLSRPDQCIETFGLTLLEAMAFGIPVIAPPVGGPVELVEDACEGFLIDSRDGGALAQRVLQLAQDKALCLRLSCSARERANRFIPEVFAKALRETLAAVNH